MTMLNTSNSWNVGRTAGRCVACGKELPPNTECFAALCDAGVRKAEGVEGGTANKKEAGGAAAASPFVRLDFCAACWGAGKRPEELPAETREEMAPGSTGLEMFSFWKTTVPLPQQKKKLLVDDAVLVDVFQRMEGRNEPQEVRFRFVLALILMRKRLLKYEGMEERGGKDEKEVEAAGARVPEVWRMVPRGNETAVQVINPHLTADQITEVSQQLSAILAEEV